MDWNTMITWKPVSEWSKDELAYGIVSEDALIKHYEARLKVATDKKAEIEAEIARRRLRDFWAANPTLTPIYIGDKLLVCDDLYLWVDNGTILEVSEIRPNGVVGYVDEDGDTLHLTSNHAQVFRRAWLAAHANDESGEAR